jgi:hypothetical protein
MIMIGYKKATMQIYDALLCGMAAHMASPGYTGACCSFCMRYTLQ